ncbi:unnamed protein product, partial [Rotaria sordida]
DIHLAKRFYDMAAETSTDAYLPVSIVLFKLHLELFLEKLISIFFSSSTESTTTSSTTSAATTTTTSTSTSNVNENHSTTIDFDSSWDLYLMAALLGLIGALYTIRRQRAALQRQQQPVQAPVQIYFFIFLLSSVLTLNNNSFYTSTSLLTSEKAPYCSFFSNRAPSPQPALTNCTWFKENSCCRDNEVRLIFSQVRPLIGSSTECTDFINILMCYVCSPLQYVFYRSERLHVCLSYCNRMYNACATALMKGIPVGKLYANGREFCLSRRFEINDIYNSSLCFSDDDLNIPIKQNKISDINISSTNIERPSLFKLFLVICLAAMLSFILC